MDKAWIGEISIFAGNFAPAGWSCCDGRTLQIAEYESLFQVIGNAYGGDGKVLFQLPYFSERMVIGTAGPILCGGFVLGQQEDQLEGAGDGTPHNGKKGSLDVDVGDSLPSFRSDMQVFGLWNEKPSGIAQSAVGIRHIICLEGILPSEEGQARDGTVGEIIMFAGHFEPLLWLFCDGRILKVEEYPELFSVTGDRYGGDGVDTFALPDFTGCVNMVASPASNNCSRVRRRACTMLIADTYDTLSNKDRSDAVFGGVQTTLGLGLYDRTASCPIPKPFGIVNYIICVRGSYPDRSQL